MNLLGTKKNSVTTLVIMVVLFLAVALVGYSRAGRQDDVVEAVFDGQTLFVGATKIQLQGIAAPDLEAALGPEARDQLAALALNKMAHCQLSAYRSWDAIVAQCDVEGRDLGEAMVASGFDRDCVNESEGRYQPFEHAARQQLPPHCRPPGGE